MDLKTRIAKWVWEGKVWHASETTATAGVIAVPSTTAAFMLINGTPEGCSTYYVVLEAHAVQHANAAPLNSWGLVYQVSDLATGSALLTADIATTTACVNMKGNQGIYGGAAVVSLNDTVLDDQWAPIGHSQVPIVASLSGMQISDYHKPPIIMPPRSIYSLDAVVAATGITVKLGCIWAEVDVEELKGLGLVY